MPKETKRNHNSPAALPRTGVGIKVTRHYDKVGLDAFSQHIKMFADTLDGLRSFVDLVGPFLDRKGRETVDKHAGNLAPFLLAMSKAEPASFAAWGLSEAELRASFEGNIEIIEEKDEGKGPPSVVMRVSGPQRREFETALSELSRAKERESLLYQNALVSLISAVECFLSQMLRTYYLATPDAMPSKEKVLSLDELENFASVGDARVYLVEKKVTDLMRGSFADWIKFFKDDLKLSMSYLTPYMNRLVETCERRNLLVHNSGIVNSIYLSKVSAELRQGLKKEMKLDLPRKYLDERIDYFELHGILIVAELWKKLKADDVERANTLIQIIYDHLLGARWSIAEGLSRFLMADAKMDEPSRLIGKLNYWQSVKRQGRWEEIREDVEAEDFSAKGRHFQLGLLALLERKDEFFALVPAALKGEDITLQRLREYPILEEMRKDRRFKQYKAPVNKKARRKRLESNSNRKATKKKTRTASASEQKASGATG